MSTYYIDNGGRGQHYYFPTTSSSPVTFSTNFTTPQHQSVAGFSKITRQQYYTSPSPPPPQVRARVRSVGQPEPQQHHFQFDSRQQPGHPTGNPVVYQTPGAAQFTHRNVDLWTEGPTTTTTSGANRDHYVQAQRVSVRSVNTAPQDSLQHYYSQLTPEQHHQLLQRQHQANAQRVEAPPVVIRQQSPPPPSHPVGIRSLASKFAGPTPKTLLHHPRSQSNASRNYSTSSYTSRTTTTSRPAGPMANLPMMTYSALPKSREPPVNSAEYYQMQLQQYGPQGLPNIQLAAAPAHIQHHSPLPSAGQDRFRFPDRQPAPAPAPAPKPSGNTLTSLRDQYMHRTAETRQEDSPMPPVSRTIVGEDSPQQAPVSKVFQAPAEETPTEPAASDH